MGNGPELIPAPDEATWTDEQRRAVMAITAGPRGALIGPFGPLLHSPDLMDRMQRTGEFIRWHSRIPDDLRELAILLVARHWDQGFEWHHHLPIALACGVGEGVVAAIGAGRRPESLTPEQDATWELVSALLSSGAPQEAVTLRALEALGESIVVELVATTGYYTTLAFIMNVAGTPTPSGQPLPTRDVAP